MGEEAELDIMNAISYDEREDLYLSKVCSTCGSKVYKDFEKHKELCNSKETKDKLRIIVVFRADLPEMLRAKSEVQFGHATFECAAQAYETSIELARQYRAENQLKINMEVDGLPELLKIEKMAKKRKVIHFLVTDAAHTVFNEPTITCIGLGPMSKTDGNSLTRNARMRK